MGKEFYDVGSRLAVPGREGLFEYGDANSLKHGRIPDAYLINDRSLLEVVRLENIDGIHGSPETRDARQSSSDRHGERAGSSFYGGRNIGLSGRVEAGSITAVRDTWTRFAAQFGTQQRDLLIHPPGEVPLYINEITDPQFSDPGAWNHFSNSGTRVLTAQVDGLVKAGQLSVTGAGAADTLTLHNPNIIGDWQGEDVWLHALVKVTAAAMTPTSIALYLTGILNDGSTGYVNVLVATQATPVTNTWYKLSGRIARSVIDPRAKSIGIMIAVAVSGAGNYTFRVSRGGFVLLSPEMPTPSGYLLSPSGLGFDGSENEGTPGASRSYGPCYAVNQIVDVDTRLLDESGVLIYWVMNTPTGVTAEIPAQPARSWSGRYTKAGYGAMKKDNNATARDLELATTAFYQVAGGRTYRWFIRLNVIQKPATGNLVARISWYDSTLSSAISTSDSSVIVDLDEGDYMVEATCPGNAFFAQVSIIVSQTTTANGVFEFMWADPCFVDISDYDPGCFYGNGQFESKYAFDQFIQTRRLIPRPFLIKDVRKVSENKLTEQQANRRYEREFTVGLRASDPRIYVLDERNMSLQIVNDFSLLRRQSPADFTLESGSLPVPAGYTYEGQFVTHPGGGGTPYSWSQVVYRSAPSTSRLPNGGVGIRNWTDGGSQISNWTASDQVARVYRSSESFAYENPKVVLGCAPLSFGWGNVWPNDNGSWNVILDYADFNPANLKAYSNSVSILLKRVLSNTWLELRWNGTRRQYVKNIGDGGFPATETNNPRSFQLWCSHNESGVLGSTLLTSVDMVSGPPSGLPYPPSTNEYYLVAWMLNNIVRWELWLGYPSEYEPERRLEQGSYAIPSALQSVIGSTVAGHAGWSLRIPRTNTEPNYGRVSSRPPFIHYFESIDADAVDPTASFPVIGSIDTPGRLVLRGDLVDPVLKISVPEFGGEPARTSVAKFTGTIFDSDPITIDLSGMEVTVTDQLGNDRFSLVVPGSDFALFRPGINNVSISSTSWGDYSSHMTVSWRDALASG